MKPITVVLLTLIIILISTSLLCAQPDMPSAPSKGPLGSGLGLLIAAGGIFAIMKLRRK